MLKDKIILTFLIFMANTIHNTMLAQDCDKKISTWEKIGKLPDVSPAQANLGYAGPVTGVYNDLLIVAGGANFPVKMPWLGGKKKHYNDVYLFKKSREGKLIYLQSEAKLPSEVAYAASCSTPLGVIYAGGECAGGLSSKVYLLKFDEKNLDFEQLPDLPEPLANASMCFSGAKVYLAGGETATGVSNSLIYLNLDSPEKGWYNLPKMPHAASHGIMVIPRNGNDIYFIGGRKANKNGISKFHSEVFMYNTDKQEWKEQAALPYALAAGTGLASDNHQIYIFGGDKGIVFNQTETLINAINHETDQVKKDQLNNEKIKLQTSHPGFSREILCYNIITNSWHIGGVLPFETPVTTIAVRWGKDVIIPSGEIRAGVRSPYIISSLLK